MARFWIGFLMPTIGWLAIIVGIQQYEYRTGQAAFASAAEVALSRH